MKKTVLLIAVLLAAVAHAQLPTVDLTAGMHRVEAEVADNMSARMTGLMHRKSMAQNAGMVFVF